jgi:signal transduction histidine kinase
MHEGEDRGIRLELRGVDRPVMVAGDRARIGTALRALMHAALRERADPGAVVVECSTTTDSSQAFAVIAIGGDPLVRSLARPAEATPSFDEWRGGLGLALPVGRRVIEAHGGAVWSAPDAPRAGSALRLPLSRH